MRRLAAAAIAVFLALCGTAVAAPPNTPTITEPGTDNMVLNPADVHMEAPTYSDPDGNAHQCTDWEIVTVSPPQVAWQAPCAIGVSRVHIHLGDGTFVNAHAGMQQLKFETNYKVRVRFKDSTGEFSAWRERPFSTSPAGPPGVPSPIPWAVRQSGYVVEVVATGFQLPMNIAMVPNPGNNPADPFLYVTELYGKIKVVSRSGAVSDYATGLLNFNPTGNFPGSGEQGLAGIAIEPATGDLFVTVVYEDTASTANPKPHYSKVVRLHSNDGGLTAATQTVVKDFFGEQTEHSHQISNITIGPDGKLYVHMGDGFDSSTALNLNSYRGKILRLNQNGTAPTDNPFYNAGDGINARDFVFAYGVRNPFGGAWRAADGSHYEAENGQNIDRFAKVPAGRNFGWNGGDITMRNFALYNWEPAHAPVNLAFVQPETFFGSGFPVAKMSHAYITESGPTYATGPQTRGKRISDFSPMSTGDFAGTTPQPLIEYTGTGKATANGIAAGPDGLYFTDLYKDVGAATPIDPGANILRVRFGSPPPGHVRPKSATSFKAALVPSFRECTTAPNRMHGPPLAFNSCAPPAQNSGFLTIGSPDVNSAAANMTGSVKATSIVGNPGTSADEADVRITVSVTDVRRKNNLADYTGQLQVSVSPQITDTANGPTLGDSATMTDSGLKYTVPCQATASTTVGSTCSVTTTADAVSGGTVLEGRRSVWELPGIRVHDGGSDGVVSTTPNTLFLRQGVFVP
ncbi:MAG TPA: PQQ-dependent sugar dehydrogenase [Solirubrobacterales bacterium]|nr:PQQ-dependent sugar dehydrogenase [Solirubrobacterales bacterium]